MRSCASSSPDLHAYGERIGVGVSIVCADCGRIRQSAGFTLPPCTSYSESTHIRAGWFLSLLDGN